MVGKVYLEFCIEKLPMFVAAAGRHVFSHNGPWRFFPHALAGMEG